MNGEQIQKYEYCTNYRDYLNRIKDNMPIGRQKHGCGSKAPHIEHVLEKIHHDMYEKVFESVEEAIETVNRIIEEI